MQIRLSKPEFRFSLAHFTVFGPTQRERLHGHNYTVSLELELDAGAQLIPFSTWKIPLRTVIEDWDERVLIPEFNPELRIIPGAAGESHTVFVGEDEYAFPARDLLLLPIDNSTCECLAERFLETWLQLLEAFSPAALDQLKSVEFCLEETPGQGVRVQRLWPGLTGKSRVSIAMQVELNAVHSLVEREEPHPHTWTLEWRYWTSVDQRMDASLLKNRLAEKVAILQGKSLHSDPGVPANIQADPSSEQLAIWANRVGLEMEREFPNAIRLRNVVVTLLDPVPHPWIRVELERGALTQNSLL